MSVGPEAGADSVARLYDLTTSVWTTHVVAAVARLGIADHLSAGPRAVSELAAAIGADPDSLERLARAAAVLGLLDETEPGHYRLTPVGEQLRATPGSLRDLALAFSQPGVLRPIEHLADAVRTGEPVAKAALGQEVWDYFRDHPEEGLHFSNAMTGVSARTAAAVAAALDTSGRERIVDVGGGHGWLLSAVLAEAPQAAGVLFDLPAVIETARQPLAADAAAGRMELSAGDFFQEVPADGDLYLLQHVLHDWDDESSARILRNIRRVARPGHTVVVIELLLARPQLGRPYPYLMDLLMLAMTGGRERTRADFEALFARAGYRLRQVTPIAMDQNLIEATVS